MTNNSLKIQIDNYSGPLEVLLELAKSQKVDLANISITQLADQFIEFINRAKEIKTYDISILPYEDCCSFFVPPHPETKAKMEQIESLDNKLDLTDLINKAIDDTEKINMNFGDSL